MTESKEGSGLSVSLIVLIISGILVSSFLEASKINVFEPLMKENTKKNKSFLFKVGAWFSEYWEDWAMLFLLAVIMIAGKLLLK